ncbi:SPOR domain-containing protein [Pseudoxanthomonas daejeonensis]|uniref:SPOR domain-containing protein n=1 Tax=Pseudoxanthomonas daejeonensis TaxID=266062 RepID=UPI001EE404AD|nr:SPOR domain-containing protein [Pseudoxanthomonas daejeonensis]
MLARALIVVLVALNLGVAAWWLLQPAPPAPPPLVSDKGGAELRLLPAPADMAQDVPANAVAAAEPVAVASPENCLRVGPFNDRGAAEVAQAGLGVLLRDSAIHEEPGDAAGYRVVLPPAPDRAQAQAMAERVAAAGFEDFFVLNQGAEANGIALGAYRGRETAQRRADALRAAGFPAELRAQGASGASRWWLDGSSPDVVAVRTTFPAAQERDCAPQP